MGRRARPKSANLSPVRGTRDITSPTIRDLTSPTNVSYRRISTGYNKFLIRSYLIYRIVFGGLKQTFYQDKAAVILKILAFHLIIFLGLSRSPSSSREGNYPEKTTKENKAYTRSLPRNQLNLKPNQIKPKRGSGVWSKPPTPGPCSPGTSDNEYKWMLYYCFGKRRFLLPSIPFSHLNHGYLSQNLHHLLYLSCWPAACLPAAKINNNQEKKYFS